MSPKFLPSADWPIAQLPTAGHLDIQAAKDEAWRRIDNDLPVASRLYAVREHLNAAPADRLAQELVRCIVAADCWAVRLPSPRGRRIAERWVRYLEERARSVRDVVTHTLARSAVLDCIPVRWIPVEQVRAEIHARVGETGSHVEVTSLDLVPRVTGGHEWVARDCGLGTRELEARARRSPVAAILHWRNRTSVAVVTAAQERLRAFGTSFDAEGVAFDATELVGSVVIPLDAPPMSTLQRLARALHVEDLVWVCVRTWRQWRGANPLAAF